MISPIPAQDAELLPCPFCGGQPESAPYELKCVNPSCEAQPSVSGGSVAEAIDNWNWRPLAVRSAGQEDAANGP